ncbi:MAG: penicillin-binding transpeptidase domain-containing protein, partial [Clostridia bacterium]
FPASTMSNVDLAVQSFGQNIKVTPIQMITAVCAAVNGGKLIKPTMVREITDSNQSVVKSFSPEVVRQVVSEGVSKTVCDLMESVVTGGSGRNAQVPGYRIGGKTGTSEKIDEKNEQGVADKRLVSFCAVAPMEDPKIAILILLDEPKVPVVSGGTLVAPLVKAVLTDTLPYLGIEPKFSAEELAKRETVVPDLVGKSSEEAVSILSKAKLIPKISGGVGTITKQLPNYNQRIPAGGTVLLYTNNAAPPDSVIVPNISGMSPEQANAALVNAGLNVKYSSSNNVAGLIVAGCAPAVGSSVTPGTTVTVELRLITQHD